MSDHQYSLALTITYIPYLAVEIPAGLVLKRVGANILLPTMATLWGLTTALQGLVGSYHGLLVARFFLGLFEGGLPPGITLVLSRFYKRDQIQLRVALLFTAASLAGAFSGLLASAILGMDGRAGHRGWQWIFILVGGLLHSSQCSCVTTAGSRLIAFRRRRGVSRWYLDCYRSSCFRGLRYHPDFLLRKRKRLSMPS
jgi:MFS family permease